MKAIKPESENRDTSPEQPVFTTQEAFERAAADWSGARLVEFWNHLPKVKPVRKFTDRATALRRIWKAIEDSQPGAEATGNADKPSRTRKALKPAPSGAAQTKTEKVIALLKRPSGGTLAEIMQLTGWQPHSVRGFISAQLSKRMGLRVRSFTRQGARVYRIGR